MALSESSPFGIGIVSGEDTVLARQARSIPEPGQLLTPAIAVWASIGEYEISWQNRTAFWDDAHREISIMGQAQGADLPKHRIYGELSDTWRRTTGDASDGNTFGHIWTVGFDHTINPGDYYFIEQQPSGLVRAARYMDRSVEAGAGETHSPWTETPVAPFDVWNLSGNPQTALNFHPNLFGAGQPGLYCWSAGSITALNLTTGVWTELDRFGGGVYHGRRNDASLYVPGWDRLFVGTSQDKSQDGFVIEAGSGGALDPTASEPSIQAMPIRVQGTTSGGAHLLLDPRDDSTIMLLERDGNRVWTNSAGGAASGWVLEPYAHPFWNSAVLPGINDTDAGSWTVCSIARYGVVVAFASGTGGSTAMWRPG